MSERIVLSGQVQADLSRLIKQMEHRDLKDKVVDLLRNHFAQLGAIEERSGNRQMGQVRLKAGRYLVGVTGLWVEVNTMGRYQPGDTQLIRQIRSSISDLLARLGGMALQREVIRAIINVGYSIRTMSRQDDDLALLRMDWAEVTITLSGHLMIRTSENYQPIAERLLADLEAAGIEISTNQTVKKT